MIHLFCQGHFCDQQIGTISWSFWSHRWVHHRINGFSLSPSLSAANSSKGQWCQSTWKLMCPLNIYAYVHRQILLSVLIRQSLLYNEWRQMQKHLTMQGGRKSDGWVVYYPKTLRTLWKMGQEYCKTGKGAVKGHLWEKTQALQSRTHNVYRFLSWVCILGQLRVRQRWMQERFRFHVPSAVLNSVVPFIKSL